MPSANEMLLEAAGFRGTLILGLDTGTSHRKKNNCGYAVMTVGGEVTEAGVWRLSKNSVTGRIRELYSFAYDYIYTLKWKLMAVGIEEPWIDVGKTDGKGKVLRKGNPQVGLKLGKTWGALAAACWANDIYVLDNVHATSAKAALTGNGKASKEEVLDFARLIYPDVKQYDDADAIAVAECTRQKLIEIATRKAG